MPKIALLLFGISYTEQLNHWSGTTNRVDFRDSVDNYKKYIYHYFENLGYSIDVFIATNHVSKEIRDNIIHHYHPKKITFHKNHDNKHISRNTKIINVMQNYFQYIRDTNVAYTACIITRFDLHFKIPFNRVRIDLSKINIVSQLETPKLICDNFYIIPRHIVSNFLVVLQSKKNVSHHHILPLLTKFSSVNFMYNQRRYVADLDLYKIVRNYYNTIYVDGVNVDICNKTEMTYISHEKFIVNKQSDNAFYIRKLLTMEPRPFQWIGWMKHFSHRNCIMEFDIKFKNNIPTPNSGFYIKTHNPNVVYSDWLLNCKTDEFVSISIEFELDNIEQYILFIMDEFYPSCEFMIKNARFRVNNSSNIIHHVPIQNSDIDITVPQNDTMDIQYNDHNREIHVQKKNTNEITTHQWCGLTFTPMHISTIFEFDILFKTTVPNISDKFYLKSHFPELHYNNWLLQCKQNEYVHISIEFLLSKQEHLIVFIMDEYLHACEFSIKNVNFRPNLRIYKFLSFYTEGESIDRCINLRRSVSVLHQTISKYVDETRFYNKRELSENANTQHLVYEFENEPKYNAKTHLIGYLRWKPYIILEQLLKANEGDIIYYRDCNVEKYPNILHDIEYSPHTLEFVLRDTHLFVPIENYPTIMMKQHVKQEVINTLYSGNGSLDNKPLYNASVIVCRCNEYTIQFMRNWLKCCEDDGLISSEYDNKIAKPYFKWNTQEQAILNILLQNEIDARKLPYKHPFYSMHQRTFSIKSLRRVPRVAILLAGEMRNYNKNEILSYNNANLLSLYDCDIFVSTWIHCGKTQNNCDKAKCTYTHDSVNEDFVRKIYPHIRDIHIEDYEIWKTSMPDTYKHHYSGGLNIGQKTIDATSFPQLYKIYDANQMKINYEKANHFTYDLVIRFRPDICLIEQIPREYINPFMELDQSVTENRIWHMNPPKIFYPSRIYDIFFYGNSQTMDCVCDTWKHMVEYIEHSFDNGLPKVDCCRLLYVACITHNVQVCDIPRCIGDVYRDETFPEYRKKIETVFN